MKVVARSKVSLHYIPDDEVPQIRKTRHYKSTKEKTNKLSTRFKSEIKKSAHNKGSVVPISLVEDEEQTEEGEHNVYGFKSKKRRNQLEQFAAESVQKKAGITPRLRKKDVTIAAGSDDDDDDDTDDEEGEKQTETSSSSRQAAILPVAAENDLYFKSQNKKGGMKSSTSDHTLKKLKCRRLDHDEVVSTLKKLPQSQSMRKMEQGRKLLRQRNASTFDEWIVYLDESYNILLYGLGSKRSLIHSFCNSMLPNKDKLVVNGFFPRASVKSILSTICSDILQLASYPMEVEEMTRLVCEHYAAPGNHLYLIIHNIDGVALRSQRCQLILSRLAATRGIYVIASIDHINASLVWDHKIALNFNWLAFDATTFESYQAETAHEGSLSLQGTTGTASGGLVLSGLLHVTESLTRNARACFRMLVEDHLEGDGDDSGMSFSELYRRCREKFFVNSELNLRAHLTEFIDHKLLQMKKSPDGGDYLVVPLDRAVLVEYLEQD